MKGKWSVLVSLKIDIASETAADLNYELFTEDGCADKCERFYASIKGDFPGHVFMIEHSKEANKEQVERMLGISI